MVLAPDSKALYWPCQGISTSKEDISGVKATGENLGFSEDLQVREGLLISSVIQQEPQHGHEIASSVVLGDPAGTIVPFNDIQRN